MLELTKKNPIELKFVGPSENRDKAIAALKKLGFEDRSDTVAWNELFPEYDEKDLPGISLAGARHREGLTQKKLSEMTGIPQGHLSEIENGKRSIGVKRAKILAKALNVGYKVFL